jgi:hypothetical protein
MEVREAVSKVVDKAIETFDQVRNAVGGDREDQTRQETQPDAAREQSRPAVNKDEPAAFANPVEAGAKKPSDDVQGVPMPASERERIQPGSDQSCAGNVNVRSGSAPHTEVEQLRPAVNKDEPGAFANACESGAKKASEDVTGVRMP